MDYKKLGNIIFRFGIALIFFYFGVSALISPEEQGAMWINPEITKLISSLVPITFFMLTLGVVQIIVAFAILFKILFKLALVTSMFLLIGIIINIGINDIALRDFVTFTGLVYLLSEELNKN
jgi:hypothetical protein